MGAVWRNKWQQWKENCERCNWCSERQWYTVKEIFSLNMWENMYSESHDHSTCFLWGVHILCPEGMKYYNVLLLFTGTAPYMIKAGEELRVSYPEMIYVTI